MTSLPPLEIILLESAMTSRLGILIELKLMQDFTGFGHFRPDMSIRVGFNIFGAFGQLEGSVILCGGSP